METTTATAILGFVSGDGTLLQTDTNILLLFIIAFQIVQLFVMIRSAQNGN